MTGDKIMGHAAARSRNRTSKASHWALNLVFLAVGGVMIAPFWWTISTALGPSKEAFSKPPHWIPSAVSFQGFADVVHLIPFGQQVLNSLIVTVITVFGSLLFSLLAAYAFARLQFPGRDVIFLIFLTGLVVPPQVTMIPTYIMMRSLGLLDTLPSLWLPGLIQVFSIFLLKQHFSSLSLDLDDAAQLAGASRLRILFQIYLPMSGPVLSALAIFIAQQYWNDYLNPIIYLSTPQKFTIPVGLISLQNAFGTAPVAVVFAGITMVALPLLVLFLFTQDQLTRGISMAGVSR